MYLVLDIEELGKRMEYKAQGFFNTPLVIDISLYHHTQQFLSNSQIEANIVKGTSVIPKAKNVYLKMCF